MYLKAIFNCILSLLISTLLLCIRFLIPILSFHKIAIRQTLVFRNKVFTVFSIDIHLIELLIEGFQDVSKLMATEENF